MSCSTGWSSTRFPRAPHSGSSRRRRGACRGGSPSSARRCAARAHRTRSRGRGRSTPWVSPSIACDEPRICSGRSRPAASRSVMPPFEEISPRPLDPRLLQLSGISRASVEAHYRLYQGYVGKRNEILAALQGVDLEQANQVYSELRALKVDLTFAIGGIKNHELYFAHLGGPGGDPDGAFGALVERDFGSVEAWRRDLKATGIAGRGLGLDRLRLGRAAPVHLPRRRAEHVRGLERDPTRRARRLRARVLPRLPDRSRVLHRRVLREPRLGRRERLDLDVPHPGAVGRRPAGRQA